METASELPSYEDVHLDRAPSLTFSRVYSVMTLSLDPTDMSIGPLPTEHPDVPVHYSLTSSLLKVNIGSSIHVRRQRYGLQRRPSEGNIEISSIPVYAIGDCYMKPMHSRNPKLQHILVSRSTGIFVSARFRKKAWEFCTPVPVKGTDVRKSIDPIFVLGAGPQPTVVQRHLLQFYDSKWVSYQLNDDGEAIAFEKEGGEQSKGMPILTIVKNLEEEMMDFLVSACNSDALDWARCAALHNYILAVGMQNSGRQLTADDQRSWWEYHGDAAEIISGHLSSSLIEFLRHAQMGPQGGLQHDHSFFYYVRGLTPPSALWQNCGACIGEVGGSIITLYSANDLASHPDGLVFDQESYDAILQMSIMDSFITTNGRQSWYPLETILSIWISMIHSSKFQAVSPEIHASFSGSMAGAKPWIIVPFSQKQLSDTLSAWDQYVEMIESRLPTPGHDYQSV
ncbi:hypothetical protein B7463_g12361, partial [Scytalidium lignicola]